MGKGYQVSHTYRAAGSRLSTRTEADISQLPPAVQYEFQEFCSPRSYNVVILEDTQVRLCWQQCIVVMVVISRDDSRLPGSNLDQSSRASNAALSDSARFSTSPRSRLFDIVIPAYQPRSFRPKADGLPSSNRARI